MSNILEIHNLSKSIDNKIIFENINLTIPYGSICCLIGANGTGKSVLIDCILGFQKINQGKIIIKSQNITNRNLLRLNTGIVSPDHQKHLELLTPKEYFDMIIDIYNLNNIEKKLDSLIDKLMVRPFLQDLFINLSFGSKKKIQLIGNLLFEPSLLICDEIFEGLDEESVKRVKEIFQKRAINNQTTFFTTHIKKEAIDISNINLLLHEKKITYI
ncbi:ABC transporter ATP-binding protein [Bacillus cereus]|uniref:ATP-binding cassette domain-containing protein n=1 Tax=Bacillus cereus TaxID=1396 RepID=UPI0018F305AC|nr:ATP-binding cassette domain-containing protein [Bacillus cereus]MBJ8055862.1 ABC transporter ATP-binding protein [Bacillus cereus]